MPLHGRNFFGMFVLICGRAVPRLNSGVRPILENVMRLMMFIVLSILAAPVAAQIYTCPDGRGGKTYQQTPCSSSSGGEYVRCIRPNGSSYVKRGASCPARTEVVQHQPGMVLDVTTGQQKFMIPGGGNGMIDPATGQRHELISPQPSRRVYDQPQQISASQACAEAKADLDLALSNPNRTMTTIRRAQDHYDRLCGR